jgi:hypothetical protein
MPRSEWATERFLYRHDISQTDSVKRIVLVPRWSPTAREDNSFLVAGRRIDCPALLL